MSEDLKPCPFCGSGAIEVSAWEDHTTIGCLDCDYGIRCQDCDEEDVVDWWNTRPAEEALKKEVERLKRELKLADSAAELTCLKLESEVKKLKAALFGIANFGKGQPFKFRTKAEYVDNFRLIQKFAKDALGKDNNVPTKESEGKDE